MADLNIKIFLIEPNDKQYNAKIVRADDERSARSEAHAEFNSAQVRDKNRQIPPDNDVYKYSSSSTCKEISFERVRCYPSDSSKKEQDTVVIKYNGNEYHLKHGDAEDLKNDAKDV